MRYSGAMTISIIIFAIIVIAILALVIFALDNVSMDSRLKTILKVLSIIVAIVLIAQRAGLV